MATWFSEVLFGTGLTGSVAGAALAWYVAMLVVGLAGLFPAMVIFTGLGSRGVYLARPLGLALVALFTWLIVHLTPATYGTAVVVLSLGTVASYGLIVALARQEIIPPALGRWREILLAEAVTVSVFVLVLLVRIQAPDAWGTEKPADLMLLTAVHRALEFPPPDPWLAGEALSYYHLGHVQVDHLARIAGVAPAEAFNLATATAGAMAVAAAVGLALDITRLDILRPSRAVRRRVLVFAGGVTAAGLLLVAPLVGLVQVLAANGIGSPGWWGRLGVDSVPTAAGATALVPDAYWWWWPTTRVVPGVISEYPAFSLILGDPHPHLLALPLGLVALALAVQVFAGATQLTWRRWLVRPELLVFTASVFAALAMTNSWDVVTYGALWAAAAWWAATRAGWPLHTGALVVVRWAALPTLAGLLLATPFLGSLDIPPLGLALVRDEASDLPRWLLFWLPVLLPGLAGAAVLSRMESVSPPRSVVPIVLLAVPAVLWTAAMVVRGDAWQVVERGGGWLTVVVLVAVVAWLGRRALGSAREDRGQETALWLLGSAGVVLLVTEFVHIDDLFPGRMNTAFKFWFHAWVIAAIAGGALVAIAIERWGERWSADRQAVEASGAPPMRSGMGLAPRVALALLTALWLATMVPPPLMMVSRAREGQERGLDAVAYVRGYDEGLGAAIEWGGMVLNPSRHVVVEAVGESFRDGNRFSAFTGVPTVLGWPGHQRQWRSDVREGDRRGAVAAIYLGDAEARQRAVREWGVTHVLVGNAERLAYGASPRVVQAGWPLVFAEGLVQVYEVPVEVRGVAASEGAR